MAANSTSVSLLPEITVLAHPAQCTSLEQVRTPYILLQYVVMLFKESYLQYLSLLTPPAPCAPVLSDVILNCTSRCAAVTWSSSGMSADVFSVSAVNAQGGQLGCSSTNGSSCVVAGLQCGQTYTFSVNATQGQCTSGVSNTLQRQTGNKLQTIYS